MLSKSIHYVCSYFFKLLAVLISSKSVFTPKNFWEGMTFPTMVFTSWPWQQITFRHGLFHTWAHLKQTLDHSFQAQFSGLHLCSKTTFTLDQTHPNGTKWPSVQKKVQVWKHPKADSFSQTFQITLSCPWILQDSIYLHCNSSSLVENDAASDQWAGPNENPSQTYHLGSHHL